MSNSRTPPQEGAASHYYERADNTARRETTVGESSQSTRNPNPTSAQAGSPRHEGAESQLQYAPYKHAHATPKQPLNHDRETGVERVEDPSQVQGSALPAGGPRKGAQP